MRIVQVVTTLAFGDAVGNDTLALKQILKEKGYKTAIYAENIDSRLPIGSALPIEQLHDLKEDDIIIYHLAIATDLNYWIKEQPCKKIMIYHNITPPSFFEEYDSVSSEACRKGLQQTEMLKDVFDYVIADSEYNKQDLQRMGYTCPIVVVPILIAFEDYKKSPSKKVINQYDDDYTNIIFVGRIAPNKKQEDIIKAFYYYQKYYNNKSRLFLVGSYNGMERYYNRLQEFVEKLGAENICFTGHIKFDEILAYYHIADLFLCMSEHEGFCVPLVESMFFDVPIVAYDSCAIKYTLGESGVLLDEKNFVQIAAIMDSIIRDTTINEKIRLGQKEQLKVYDNAIVAEKFIEKIEDFINND